MKRTWIILTNFKDVRAKIEIDPEFGASPMDRKSEIGQPIIYNVILDISRSMEDFYDELVACFNRIMIPSLKEAIKRNKSPLRLGCLLFSEKLLPAWKGFRSLNELGSEPLKRSTLEQSGLQGRTALYGAMKAGILWTAASMEHMKDHGQGEVPKGKIIVLTDGDNNEPPMRKSAVTKARGSMDPLECENLSLSLGFLNTNNEISEVNFRNICRSTGFQDLGFYTSDKNNTLQDRRDSFKNQFRKIFR